MSDIQTDPAADAAAETPEQPTPAFSPGGALREARERLGLGIAEVADRTKLAPRQIEALETDDFAKLPETAFVRGFVRSYAKLLQIDPAPLLAALPGAPAPSAPLEPRVLTEVVPIGQSASRLNLVWLVSALVVTLLLGVFVWLFERASDAPQTRVDAVELPMPSVAAPPEAALPVSAPEDTPAVPAPAPEAFVPAPAVTAAPAPAPVSANAPIRVTFEGQSWVEITDKDGKALLSKIGRAGDEDRVDGTPPFNVVVGHASSVKLYYKGKPVELAAHARSEVARLALDK